MTCCDFIVIGGGIAGTSVAYELQAHGQVVLLEREPMVGQHTTGRSAAFLVESYGNEVVQHLTRAGRGFLEAPPAGFAAHPVLSPRPSLWIAREDQRARLEADYRAACEAGVQLQRIELDDALSRCPVLRRDYVAAAVAEPGAMSIDVAALLEGYLRGLRSRGGVLRAKAEVTRISRDAGEDWRVEAGGELLSAPVVVNAAGAWADVIARLAGVAPIGLRPLRRTAIIFDAPEGCDIRDWPCVIDANEDFYMKPSGGQLLASPCDETPSSPCDAAPDDYDVALAADRIQRATTISVDHIRRRWAGLRSFVSDRAPVVGMERSAPGFFWLVGQGGFGIMTSSSVARAAAGLITACALPEELVAQGLTAAMLAADRPTLERA